MYIERMLEEKLPLLKKMTADPDEQIFARDVLKGYLEFVDIAAWAAGAFYEKAAWTAAEKWTQTPGKNSFSAEAAADYEGLWQEEIPQVLKKVWDEKLVEPGWCGTMPEERNAWIERFRVCTETETKTNYQYSCMENMLTPWEPSAGDGETSERKKKLEQEKSVIRMWMFPDRQELHSTVWFEMTSDEQVDAFCRSVLKHKA